MRYLSTLLFAFHLSTCFGQAAQREEEAILQKVLETPSPTEISEVLIELQSQDLTAKNINLHDTIPLSNGNSLYVISHTISGQVHYGAVIIPKPRDERKLPVVVFATGGDGMHTAFDVTQDFNHQAAQFPKLLGSGLDETFIIVIPSFRGQQLILGDKKYQSSGNISDAFDGATTDALAFLNVALKIFKQTDKNRIAIYGGSRGGTVALLASARDPRIKRVIAVAAPTDMKSLYLLYPDQFKLLFFNELLAGKISTADARKKFISSSPIYFTKHLPLVQLHHDRNDPFVPVRFAQMLSDSLVTQNKNDEVFFYNEGIHGFWVDGNFWKRVQEFLSQL